MIEDDRRRLAMELHDHFGQVLTTLKLELELLGSEVAAVDPLLGPRVDRAAAIATATIADLKSLAAGLMPTMIEDLGLIPALQALIDSLRDSAGLDIRFFSNGIGGRFEREKELALYRIAQESLNNVVKHAQARRVDVNLLNKNGWASLSVEDDGVGFAGDDDESAAGRCGGMGLQIMHARATKFGGELTIDSRPGEGVHVLAEIPLA
jgi:signal transduction histidine kinase